MDNEPLPVGEEFHLTVPGINDTLNFTTDEPGHNFFNTVYNAIRVSAEEHKGIFEQTSLSDVSTQVHSSITDNITEEEEAQYQFAINPDTMLPLNAHTRFLALVISRYNN